MKLFLLIGLSSLVAAAALALVARARVTGRALQLVAATLLWNLLIALPIYGLGVCGRLTAGALGLTAAALAVAVFAGAARGPGFPDLGRDVLAMARGLARLPLDAVLTLWRARSPLLPALLCALVLVPYLGVAAYLAPAFPRWDGLWYHEPMIAYAIQNHGFAVVELPWTLDKINGYPRLAEMTQLWFVIFTDHRLIDVANVVFAPALAAAVYALTRAAGAGARAAIGWGAAMILFPACASLLQSSFSDPQNAALLLGGVVFVTRSPLKLREAFIGAVGLALAIASKAMSLTPVFILGLITAVRVVRTHGATRRLPAWGTVVGGFFLIGLATSHVYLRNYLLFRNPFWPDLKVDVPALGIHWPGLVTWDANPGNPNGWKINMNLPWPAFISDLLSLPWSVKRGVSDQSVDYGMAVGWILAPLGAVAWLVAVVRGGRAAIAAARGRSVALAPSDVLAFVVAAVLAVIVKGSPALWGARYHIATVGLLMVLVAWLTSRPALTAIGDAAVTATSLLFVMFFVWTPAPHWCPAPSDLVAMAGADPVAREAARGLGPNAGPASQARERELTAGKLLVYDDNHNAFASLFWNNDFSNRVQYLKTGPDLLARAAALGATWVYLVDGDPQLAAARAPRSGWQEVGLLNAGHAFRRVP